MADLLGPPAEGKPPGARTVEVDAFGAALEELIIRPVHSQVVSTRPGQVEVPVSVNPEEGER